MLEAPECFRVPLQRALLVVAMLLAFTVFFAWEAYVGAELSFLGVRLGGPWVVAAAALSLTLAAYFVPTVVRRRPWLILNESELIWNRFPVPKRIRWQDVEAITEPQETRMTFGARFASMRITLRDGSSTKVMMPPDDALGAYDATIRRWRSTLSN